jgi:hypothetical protein
MPQTFKEYCAEVYANTYATEQERLIAEAVRLVDSNGVFALAVDEKYGGRIAALWNMAERLGLSTEEIESGNVETTLKAAPYMLEALEWLSNEFDCRDDEYGMVGFTHDEFRKVEAAIRKARGEE